ncbi:hypothetical protein J3D48_006140 [Pseudomonas fluorescens]|uniref:hypothetical protein n=1 Tax=Pseudomonas fluorescens TaxID=294 RepID=UPI00209DFC3C|nr:hypothetical protein [Pseudomonas fluorescens]MCP1489730.1 hypothetical protein [Pseudomonas fluorescens]
MLNPQCPGYFNLLYQTPRRSALPLSAKSKLAICGGSSLFAEIVFGDLIVLHSEKIPPFNFHCENLVISQKVVKSVFTVKTLTFSNGEIRYQFSTPGCHPLHQSE